MRTWSFSSMAADSHLPSGRQVDGFRRIAQRDRRHHLALGGVDDDQRVGCLVGQIEPGTVPRDGDAARLLGESGRGRDLVGRRVDDADGAAPFVGYIGGRRPERTRRATQDGKRRGATQSQRHRVLSSRQDLGETRGRPLGIGAGFFYATRRRATLPTAPPPRHAHFHRQGLLRRLRAGRSPPRLIGVDRCGRRRLRPRARRRPGRDARPGHRNRHARCAERHVRCSGLRRRHRRFDDSRRRSPPSTCPNRWSRVPGVFAANRNNYAQDLQMSSRGYGARATFGVRGVRLYQDDIPATMPDGQGQTGSFSLLSARAHRSAARAVLHAVWQCVRRRGVRVHRKRNAGAGRRISPAASAATARRMSASRPPASRTAWATSRPSATSTPTAIANTRPRCARSPTPSSRSTRPTRRTSR